LSITYSGAAPVVYVHRRAANLSDQEYRQKTPTFAAVRASLDGGPRLLLLGGKEGCCEEAFQARAGRAAGVAGIGLLQLANSVAKSASTRLRASRRRQRSSQIAGDLEGGEIVQGRCWNAYQVCGRKQAGTSSTARATSCRLIFLLPPFVGPALLDLLQGDGVDSAMVQGGAAATLEKVAQRVRTTRTARSGIGPSQGNYSIRQARGTAATQHFLVRSAASRHEARRRAARNERCASMRDTHSSPSMAVAREYAQRKRRLGGRVDGFGQQASEPPARVVQQKEGV